ncbi:MAG: hypothetical protein COA96_03215 [SAR86 cluster bacterium]|uniref:DNA alkylation repair protein n=1 Tax=SAR86 cluster bacterium TaxID=2030880 RepID=A0A2A5B7J9_9GAMM|nr:MAG: hypothetical protein COA96_03215 [SAR86 cluster bacterium]
MNLRQIMNRLELLADPEKIELKRNKFAITANNSLGVYHKDLKALAKEIGQDDKLALELYDTGIYEARLLCSKIYNPQCISEKQMERWAADFENWEICDSFCMGFFVKSSHALPKAKEWTSAENEFVKRAGFVIMAAYGFAHKHAANEVFERFFKPIVREAGDDRLYVKKAVNWALRNIGKRNIDLHAKAIEVANQILTIDSGSARWIAKNALSELAKPGINILNYPRLLYKPAADKPTTGRPLQ